MSEITTHSDGQPRAPTSRELLTVATSLGLAAGLIEAVNAAVRRKLWHLPTGEYTISELFWMVPLAATVTLLTGALFIVLLDRVLGARGTLRTLGLWAFAVATLYGLLQALFAGLLPFAALLLAAGIAAAILRSRERWLPWCSSLLRRELPIATLLLAVWALGVPAQAHLREKLSKAQLPEPAQDAPNVLLIIWDTVRALSVSLYGSPHETTPVLAAFAREGVVFDRAFATSSWSLPSHASMYTGREAHEFHIDRQQPLDGRYPTLAEELTRRGYVTAGFTGNLFYGSRDFGIARGFKWYDDEAPLTLQKLGSTWSVTRRLVARWRRYRGRHDELVRRPAPDVTDSFLDWVDGRDGRPFFASLNYFDAHEPYIAPPPFDLAFSQVPPRYWEGDQRPTDPAVLRDLQTAYESSIRYLDAELQRLLDQMRARGLLDNTLVIVTSDHGEQFGDHGVHLLGHERSLYASALRVPLVLVFPGRVSPGVRRTEPVSVRDIPATVMDALGLTRGHPFPGISLLRYANGGTAPSEAAAPRLALLRPNKLYPAEMEWANREQHRLSVVADSLHYLVNASGIEELYDYVHDPWETHNLAADGAADRWLTVFRNIIDSAVPDSLRVAPRTVPDSAGGRT